MRRSAREAGGVAVAVAAGVYAWAGLPRAPEALGSGVGGWAADVEALRAGRPVGAAALYDGVAAALAAAVGLPAALTATACLGVGAGAAAIWWVARARGAPVAGALLAVAVGALPPVAAQGLAAGAPAALAVPLVVAALVARTPPLRLAAVLACAGLDARLGAAAGVAAGLAGGGAGAWVGAVVAVACGPGGLATGTLDPADLGAPWLRLRPTPALPGMAALAGAALFVEDRALRRAALGAWVLALGPVLSALGDPLLVGGDAVPLPAAVLLPFDPDGAGWTGALLVAGVASGLGLARVAGPRVALLLVPLALAEDVKVAGPELPRTSLRLPVSIRYLGERHGAVLDLPVEVAAEPDAAPAGSHGLYRWYGAHHGRPVADAGAPLPDAHPLFGEPGVVLSVDAALGDEPYLVPDAPPGAVLRGLGVTEIVVHRDRFAPAALAVIDPLFARMYGPPQRDHAGDVDLYRLPATGPASPAIAERLRRAGDPAAKGWRTVGETLRALTPTRPAAGGIPSRAPKEEDAGND